MIRDEDGLNPVLDLRADDEFVQESPQALPPVVPLIPKPSQEHIDQAREYCAKWMKESYELVKRKLADWRLYEDLYYNRRKLSKWEEDQSTSLDANVRNAVQRHTGKTVADWRADFTIPCSQFIDAYRSKMSRSIFASRDFLEVEARAGITKSSTEDDQFPTAKKLQAKLIDTSKEMKFRTRTNVYLRDMLVFGTGLAKELWVEDTYEQLEWNEELQAAIPREITWRQGVQVKLINPEYILPDPHADSSDPQFCDGIGDRAIVSWEECAALFGDKDNPGPYNLGKDEFFERWPSAEEAEAYNTAKTPEVSRDADQYTLSADSSKRGLMRWERHGRVWFTDKTTPVECVDVFLTGLQAEDPTEGVFVRHQERPILLNIGKRPYLVTPFIPQPGFFGMGLIEMVQRLVYILSHLINKLIDGVRLEADPMLIRGGASRAVESDAKGDTSYPGKIWDVMDVNDLKPFSFDAKLQQLIQAIQFFDRMLQLVTSVDQGVRSVPTPRETATAFAGRTGQAVEAIMDVLDTVVENYLEPYGHLALAYFQERIFSNLKVPIQDAKGVWTQVELTQEELRTGEYVVTAALDTQEPAKISKAQMLSQLVPILEQERMALAQFDGRFLSMSRLFDEIFDLAKVPNPDKILPVMTPEQQGQMAAMTQPQPEQGAEGGEGEAAEGADQTAMGGAGSQVANMLMAAGIDPQEILGGNGGPAGEEPFDLNALMATLQAEGMLESPVTPGDQGPAYG